MGTIRWKVKFAYLLLFFFVILGPENVYLDAKSMFSKWFRNWVIDTCMFWRPFWKMAAIKVKGQIWNGPIAKIYLHDMFS